MKTFLISLVLILCASAPRGYCSDWGGACDAQLSSKAKGQQIAESAGLHYVTPGGPGIDRIGTADTGFRYRGPSGAIINDPGTLERIQELRIPPNYKNVWISADPDAHIQAIAEDSKGRIQYRYHPRWIAAKADVKFGRMIQFGRALESIHEAESADLALSGLPKRKMLAGLAKLMERSSIRVGSERYALENESFGLTTLLNDNKQVTVRGDTIHFDFYGKSGVFHAIDIKDHELAVLTRKSLALGDSRAFEYVGEDGVAHELDAADLNNYLRDISGGHFSAKDFRTWTGTTYTAKFLLDHPQPANAAEAEGFVTEAIQYASEQLGNTPAVCRSNYVDPKLIAAYMDGSFARAARGLQPAQDANSLKPEEQLVLKLLGN